MKNVTIIIPVYRGLDETRECILSVVDNLPSWADLLVINDCSPEADLTEWLRIHSKEKKYVLLENSINKGFVETVNRGMKVAQNNDVLLLNSDVEVPNSDWLDRMRTAAYSTDKLASITPFSNNATICSFPNFCEDNELFLGLNVTDIDKVFSELDLTDRLVEIPTGVGFCMYIAREALNEVGLFDDDTFGRGYGEENDWCQRAIKAGWKNYHQLNVFAFHKGGVSFAEEGDPRKIKALELLQKLHPNYDLDVHKFIKNDPASRARLEAVYRLLNRYSKRKVLLVSHCLGGGVRQHIDELVNLFSNDALFLLLVPLPNSKGVQLSICNGSDKHSTSQSFEISVELGPSNLLKFLSGLSIDRIHFHQTMGYPDFIYSLADELNINYDITVHDYYLINGNPTLTNTMGRFVGDDHPDFDHLCVENYPITCGVDEWKSRSVKFLNSAQRVIYPSIDVYCRFKNHLPLLKDNHIVTYHPDISESELYTDFTKSVGKKSDNKKVLVFGAISREKGADVLELAAENTEIEFHLIGYAYRPLKRVITHGPYELNELEEKIKKVEPDVIWFPAVWPETYSYTLSAALKLEYPIICSNLGSFVERVSYRPDSIILPWDLKKEEMAEFWNMFSLGGNYRKFDCSGEDLKKLPTDIVVSDFYAKEYLGFEINTNTPLKEIDIASLCFELTVDESLRACRVLGKKERLLLFLWKLRNKTFFRTIVKYIPYKWQRMIKRKLSSKPIHDIID